jgi:hypothetical protein
VSAKEKHMNPELHQHHVPPLEKVPPLVKPTEMMEMFAVEKGAERRRELVGDMLEVLIGTLQAEKADIGEDAQRIYEKIAASPGLLIRQERFDKLIELLEGSRVDLGFVGDKPYANSAVYGKNGEGVEIAFNEGRASRFGLAILAAISPEGPSGRLEVEQVPPAQCELRDRTACRMISGAITKENLRHIVVRIPRQLAPDYLKDEGEGHYIFRTASFEEDK